MTASPVIFGLSGKVLTEQEREFFIETKPFGFILFARNIEDREQLKDLVADLKSCVYHEAKILIDQEGGRVARLKAPHWTHTAPCGTFESEKDPEDASYKAAACIAAELDELGINVDCAPMIDVRQKDAHDIVGDRAFSEDPYIVAKLGRAFMNGLHENGVDSVIKHIPGHGRAKADSHFDLPVVDASLEELREIDFVPFKELNDAPFAMTAHIVYSAIDADNCATQSKKVIDIIRNEIGFKGLIMTDDLSMKALKGTFADRTKRSLEAGCDLILHCNGDMKEMKEIAAALPVEEV